MIPFSLLQGSPFSATLPYPIYRQAVADPTLDVSPHLLLPDAMHHRGMLTEYGEPSPRPFELARRLHSSIGAADPSLRPNIASSLAAFNLLAQLSSEGFLPTSPANARLTVYSHDTPDHIPIEKTPWLSALREFSSRHPGFSHDRGDFRLDRGKFYTGLPSSLLLSLFDTYAKRVDPSLSVLPSTFEHPQLQAELARSLSRGTYPVQGPRPPANLLAGLRRDNENARQVWDLENTIPQGGKRPLPVLSGESAAEQASSDLVSQAKGLSALLRDYRKRRGAEERAAADALPNGPRKWEARTAARRWSARYGHLPYGEEMDDLREAIKRISGTVPRRQPDESETPEAAKRLLAEVGPAVTSPTADASEGEHQAFRNRLHENRFEESNNQRDPEDIEEHSRIKAAPLGMRKRHDGLVADYEKLVSAASKAGLEIPKHLHPPLRPATRPDIVSQPDGSPQMPVVPRTYLNAGINTPRDIIQQEIDELEPRVRSLRTLLGKTVDPITGENKQPTEQHKLGRGIGGGAVPPLKGSSAERVSKWRSYAKQPWPDTREDIGQARQALEWDSEANKRPEVVDLEGARKWSQAEALPRAIGGSPVTKGKAEAPLQRGLKGGIGAASYSKAGTLGSLRGESVDSRPDLANVHIGRLVLETLDERKFDPSTELELARRVADTMVGGSGGRVDVQDGKFVYVLDPSRTTMGAVQAKPREGPGVPIDRGVEGPAKPAPGSRTTVRRNIATGKESTVRERTAHVQVPSAPGAKVTTYPPPSEIGKVGKHEAMSQSKELAAAFEEHNRNLEALRKELADQLNGRRKKEMDELLEALSGRGIRDALQRKELGDVMKAPPLRPQKVAEKLSRLRSERAILARGLARK